MVWAGRTQIWHRGGALSDAQCAARLEGASWRQRCESRDGAGNRLKLVTHELRRRSEQARRVRMARAFEDFPRGAFLDNATGVRDGDSIGHLRDYSQIVRDEKQREAKVAAKLCKQF